MERRNDSSDGGGKIKIGVCVMEKKVWCSPMEQILERLRAFGEFEIIIFGDKVILEDPIESWPLCDCLIAFYSAGYPLEKTEKYAALRRPFLVNELDPQYLLHDRSKVYEHLKLFGVPVPTYAVVRREYPNQELNYFVEQDDFIEIHGKRFCKPFVEKPIDGDDHNIMIYYPSSAGGGMKELFRKVGNRSSEFYPDVRKVRRDGSYIYEEFMPTGGTDVKVTELAPSAILFLLLLLSRYVQKDFFIAFFLVMGKHKIIAITCNICHNLQIFHLGIKKRTMVRSRISGDTKSESHSLEKLGLRENYLHQDSFPVGPGLFVPIKD